MESSQAHPVSSGVLAAPGAFPPIGEDDGRNPIESLLRRGDHALKLGRLSEAEVHYRRLLENCPSHLAANQRLLNLLRIEGRNWEALPALHQLLRGGRFVFEELALAGPLDAVWLNSDCDLPFLEHCGRVAPDDLLCLLGPACSQIAVESSLDQALANLRRIVKWSPSLIAAQAALGQRLLQMGADQDFLLWHSQLSKAADSHPSIWLTRARWARGNGDTRGAIRCLWEAIKICPNDRASHLLMANLLSEIGDSEQAALFQQRGEHLQTFENLLTGKAAGELALAVRATKMIGILEQLGRLWEAKGWSHLLLSREPDSSYAKTTIARLDRQLKPETPLTLASANPANIVDYSKFPLPVFPRAADSPPQEDDNTEPVASFLNVAEQAQLNFTYFKDSRRLASLVYTFDFAGGAVGVLDFDRDGWPDLYLTQSCAWPPTNSNSTQQNRLFLNRQGRFEDCTLFAGVGDVGFSHGVAVGDVDEDGFPDLYVNNLGRNRLYLNNGDGTFADWTEQSGTAGDAYSLSAVFVDLNRDALPDLYVVNYLDGDALTRQCQRDGTPIQCPPQQFRGQQDRLYINLGDGRFRDVTDESGILDPAGIGKGMDVIAADFDGADGPDLFVANDTTANFLFVNRSEARSQSVRLEDQGILAGVAYDDLGRTQSSMGIAARDVNRDGLLDLFVTNFLGERNNLFIQTMRQPSLLFSDRSSPMKLSEPSFLTMGWGTQFLDVELDGDWDLAVANGYLGRPIMSDQHSAGPEVGKMRPQFFENQGGVRFREVSSGQLGPYFDSTYFGRSMARLDVNRDGLEDLCVTHSEAPVALLQNTSQRRGRFAAVQLRGVASSRDAVGSTVHVSAGGRQSTVQLTAGGGFGASSEQQIVVGLGDCELIERLEVRWPDESGQVFHSIPSDRRLVLIQGRPAPVILP